MSDDEIRKIIEIATLKNSVEFNGKANPKAVMGKLIGQRPDLKPQAKKYFSLINEICNEINKLPIDKQKEKLLQYDPDAFEKKEKVEEKKELPELPNVDKYDEVIMRLAPYPSGALHIGNARMVVLNNEYVNRYNGELVLFFDDTIGSPQSLRDSPKAKFVLPEAYDLIEEGLRWLNVEYSKVYYKSERLDIYYDYCEKLINDYMAYICCCDAATFREQYKKKKIDCPHRNQSIDKNIEEWNNMLSRKYHETEAVVRLKTGMDQKDPALRDQIIMRISEAEHPRVGKKYTVWPMLEFSWAIDDHLIGASHILRGIDLVKEDFVEEFIWNHFNWRKAEFLHYGRIKFSNMKLSKTESRNNIAKGIYEGWYDPRTWSLQSLEKRGIKPDALKKTLLDLGMSITGIQFDESWLYSNNQAIIDDKSNRYFYVENPHKVVIGNVPFSEYVSEAYLLPSTPNKGRRKIKVKTKEGKLFIFLSQRDATKLKSNQILRLKDLMNIEIISVDKKGKKIEAEYHSTKLNRKFPIIHWVLEEENVKVSVLKPDGKISEGYGETNLSNIPLNQVIQFERFGFVNPIKWENDVLYCYFTH